MCGRYELHCAPEVVIRAFGLTEIPAYKPRYNIPPFSRVLIIRKDGATPVRWGLIPHWTKEASRTLKPHNARADSMIEIRKVSRAVNDARRDSPELLDPDDS